MVETISGDTVETLRWATATRASIKGKLDELNTQLKAVNETAKSAMQKADMLQWKDNIGTISIKPGYEVTTLKKDRLIVAMLQRGLSAAAVEAVIKAGSETKMRAESVEFRLNAED